MNLGRRAANSAWIVLGAVLLSAPASRADLLGIDLSGNPNPTQACRNFANEASSLYATAVTCRADSECFHYPCSCSALARGSASDRYKDIVEILFRECSASKVSANCGTTVPVCVNGKCTTRAVGEGIREP